VTFTLEDLTKLIAKRHFCILATQGLHGPHAVGVGYFASGLDLYIPASAKAVKVRNIRRDQRVAVHIPIPWPMVPAPQKSIQFRGRAEILPTDDKDANAALARASIVVRRVFGRLLERAGALIGGEPIWIHVRPVGRIETFWVGMSMFTIFQGEGKAALHFDVPKQAESNSGN
jgi:nitroimidazol reductase NimA-like FMN-containing flavoprotein (pyridoxamine 5'-phosphate oxidase superfamily)